LTLKEMALLVGLPKAPSYYAPTKNYEISLGRANRVVERLYTLKWIDKEQHDKALKEKPVVYNDTLTQNKHLILLMRLYVGSKINFLTLKRVVTRSIQR